MFIHGETPFIHALCTSVVSASDNERVKSLSLIFLVSQARLVRLPDVVGLREQSLQALLCDNRVLDAASRVRIDPVSRPKPVLQLPEELGLCAAGVDFSPTALNIASANGKEG